MLGPSRGHPEYHATLKCRAQAGIGPLAQAPSENALWVGASCQPRARADPAGKLCPRTGQLATAASWGHWG